MSRLTAPRVLVIGELNVDIVAAGLTSLPKMGMEILARDCELTLGSASAIFAVGLAKLGCRVTFVGQVGKDSFGDFCLRILKESGISTKYVNKTNTKTGVTISFSDRRDRALITYPGAIASFGVENFNTALIKRHQHLHLTSYYLQRRLRPSFPTILRQAKAEGLTTSFDPNADPTEKWDKGLNKVLRYTDVLFVNQREAREITGLKNSRDAVKALGQLVRCAVIKLGPKGAVAIDKKKIVADSGFKSEAVDTTGAGDSFDAGFVSAYLQAAPLVECLRVGNACGALSTRKLGGINGQPTQQELRAFFNRPSRPGPFR